MAWLAAGGAHAQTTTVTLDFDSPGTVGTSFNYNTSSQAGQAMTGSATGGVGNSGSIAPDGSSMFSSTVYKTAIPNAAGSTITLSCAFKTRAGSLAATAGDVVGLGLVGGPSYRWITNGEPSLLIPLIIRDLSGENETGLMSRAPSMASGGPGINPVLSGDRWYRYTAAFANTGSGWQITASVYDLGSNGLAAPVLFGTLPVFSVSDATGLTAASQVYVGLSGGDSVSTTATVAVDDLSITYPTPAAPQLTVSPTSQALPSTPVGQTSSASTITLSNSGSASLSVSGIAMSGGDASSFTVTKGTCASLTPSLAPAASCTILVSFSPTSLLPSSSKATMLHIISNGGTTDVALSGAAGQAIPTLSEWGMIVLAALLAASMVVAMRRRDGRRG